MARPERNNVDYFPHPVSHGKKMRYLEKKYKNDGYATWFKILEELGNTNYHYLNLQDEIQVMYLEEKCNISKDILFSIIDDLIKLKEFDKNLWEKDRILFNSKFIETIKDAYNKRNNNCITYDGLLLLLTDLGILKLVNYNSKGDGNTQTKVKKTKVKKTKTWCDNIEIYKNDLRIRWKEIITLDYIKEREKFHPNLDILLSLEKSIKDYWLTEAGWKKKKNAAKGKENYQIDWKSTFNNALTLKSNQVYKKNDEIDKYQYPAKKRKLNENYLTTGAEKIGKKI